MSTIRIRPFVFVALALVGVSDSAISAGAKKAKANQPDPYAPTLSEAPALPAQPNGSIFQVANGYTPLTSGARASSVGDVITIQLVENTQASKSNSAGADRSGSIGLTPPATGPLSFVKPTDVSAGGGSTFKGAGTAAQSNALTGQVTVTVAKVYPNGNLLVRGRKALTLNRGDEFITISGIIRPVDIGTDNRVDSTRVADADITYTGKGEIARASRQGWLQRFFSMLSPF